ncbi:hypothetical protein BKA59DRAFT_379041, partial [Fusarium tricinctum]
GCIQIGFGQQLQDDGANHFVAWIHGKHACPGQAVLRRLVDGACDYTFWVGNIPWVFNGCRGGDPQSISSQGRPTTACTDAKKGTKIHCGDQHDIVQHGVC